MSKNNKRTINVRTHNTFDIYNCNGNDKEEKRNEEFAAEFDDEEQDKNVMTSKNQQTHKNK